MEILLSSGWEGNSGTKFSWDYEETGWIPQGMLFVFCFKIHSGSKFKAMLDRLGVVLMAWLLFQREMEQ